MKMLAILVVMAPVVAALTEVGGFARMSLPSELVTSSVNISQGYRSTPLNLCAYECLINKKCHGYHLHVQILTECSFETCLNPNQLTQDVGNGSAVYVRDDLHTFLNKFLALGKPSRLSSSYRDDPKKAAYGNDGNYLPTVDQPSNLVHTNRETRPWWRVDLEAVYCVWAVNILNRNENGAGAWKRSKNAEITVSMKEEDIEYTGSNQKVLCYYHDGVLSQAFTLMTCHQSIRGEFVQVLFNVTDFLNLYEIEVHGM